jgi:hypothetical protein
LRRFDARDLFPLDALIAVKLIPGQLADLVEGVERCMPFRLLHGQQWLLKHRIVQIEPDYGVTARHGPGASWCPEGLYRWADGWWTRPRQLAGRQRLWVRAAGVLLAQRNIGTVMNQKPAATAAIETFQPVLSPRGSGGWIQRQRCAEPIV